MELPLPLIAPEIVLLIAATLAMLVGLAAADATRKFSQVLALLATLAAAVVSWGMLPGNPFATWAVQNDGHAASSPALYISLLTALVGVITVLSAWDMPSKGDPSTTDKHYRGEFFSMLLFSLAGVSMVGKVTDLVLLFVVLELVSIPTYILVTTSRDQIVAQEAGVKYFFLGALSAAIYLFGFSYLYGYAGSTRFDVIATQFKLDLGTAGIHGVPMIAIIGLLMVIVGVAYKIAAVPLHFYTPDVYQGAATPVTAYLAYGPKAAGFVAIISTLSLTQFGASDRLNDQTANAIYALLTVMAVLTMSVGNVLALLQRNIKRTLAYSSIAHSGYMLVGLVAAVRINGAPASATLDGLSATYFYLGSYAVMNLGAFAVLIYLQGKAGAGEEMDDIAGVAKTHPVAAIALTICLLSLIGMPFTIGFLGKLYIIKAAFASGHPGLAVITVVNAAVAAAYYLKIIAAMYLRDAWNPFTVRTSAAPRVAATICTVTVILLGILPFPLLNLTQSSTPTMTVQQPAVTPALAIPAVSSSK